MKNLSVFLHRTCDIQSLRRSFGLARLLSASIHVLSTAVRAARADNVRTQASLANAALRPDQTLRFFASSISCGFSSQWAIYDRLPPEEDRKRDEPADARGDDKREELLVLAGESGLDRCGQYPELRDVYHYEEGEARLPDCGAATVEHSASWRTSCGSLASIHRYSSYLV